MKTYKAIILCSIALLPYDLIGQEREVPFKIMTYNILTGFDWGKDTAREEKLITWVKSQNPDVLALQELCDFTQDKLEQLAQKWGHQYAVILKDDGYPVGLTSNQPIELKERLLDELWHGMLHVKTHGIDFFVVHLSPADREFRNKEAGIITQRIKKLAAGSNHYVVLGDFNAHSPFDGDFDLKYPYQLQRVRRSDSTNEKYSNLLNNQFDYGVVSTFLAVPLIDVCHQFVPMDERTTCPAPINVPEWLTMEEMKKTKSRIDFILVSPALSTKCTGAEIFNEGKIGYLSDHYPVQAVFSLEGND